MNQYMSHPNNLFPFHFFVSVSKVICQHIRSFSNDFDTLYDCILENLVVFQVFQRFVCDKLLYVVNLFDNMLKPSSVSNYFSHI